jgi:hypothetical protein
MRLKAGEEQIVIGTWNKARDQRAGKKKGMRQAGKEGCTASRIRKEVEQLGK